ncbi:MAG TPA: FMN-binding protein [Clostridiales bacterium]|nr:FMN-binding protein [Clostridiales bacterium]
MKKEMPAWLVLAIIMLVAALCLAGTNLITKGPIKDQEALNADKARKAVLADAEFEPFQGEQELSIDQLFVGKKGDEVIGYVGVITAKGYGGDIEVTVGLTPDGIITGISVGGANFAETAGLGAKAKEPKFTDQFKGKIAPLRVIKQSDEADDSTIDSITAATITTNAITRGVNSVVKQVVDLLKAPVDLGGFKAGTTTASVQGFAGPVVVEVTFDDNKTITDIKIGDDSFAETPGIGDKVLAPEFAQMLIGKSAPLTINDIDAISKATITSQAVVDAINVAIEQLSSGGMVFSAGTATASVQGFAGPVVVEVTFDDNKIITDIKIGDDSFAETPGIGDKVLAPEFAQMLIGKSAPLAIKDIDAISKATITSQAVVDAINAAFEQLLSGGGEVSDEESDDINGVIDSDDGTKSDDTDNSLDGDVGDSADSSDADDAEPIFKGGTASASAPGGVGPVAVKVTFDADKSITDIIIGDDSFVETEGRGTKVLEPEFARMLIGKVAPLTIEDIDAISGATFTSKAVVQAINTAYEQLLGNDGKDGDDENDGGESVADNNNGDTGAVFQGGTVSASAPGGVGPVAIKVTFDANKSITDIIIGDDSFVETEGRGTKVLEPEFAQMLIGKVAPLTIEDIDAISGATYTSKAVVQAINAAYEQLLGDEANNALEVK